MAGGQGTVGGHLYSNSSPPGLRRLATCPARVFTAARDGDEWRRLSGTKHRRKLIKVSHRFRGHCHNFPYFILRIIDGDYVIPQHIFPPFTELSFR